MTWRYRMVVRYRLSSGAAGFTLLETLVVLAVIGLTLALIVGHQPPWSRGFDLDATASELAAQLRLVRSEAIAGNQAVTLEFDLPARRYQAGDAASRELPTGVAVQLLTVGGDQRSVAAGIRFHPDGSSTGGRILLADRTRQIAIGVDWLTGRVTIADGQ
jgi:general secretion pathway protein H